MNASAYLVAPFSCPPAHADAEIGAAFDRATYLAFRRMMIMGEHGAASLARELRAQGRGCELWDAARFMDRLLDQDPHTVGVLVNDPNQGRAVRLVHRRFLLGV